MAANNGGPLLCAHQDRFPVLAALVTTASAAKHITASRGEPPLRSTLCCNAEAQHLKRSSDWQIGCRDRPHTVALALRSSHWEGSRPWSTAISTRKVRPSAGSSGGRPT